MLFAKRSVIIFPILYELLPMLPRNIRRKNASCALMINNNETNELPIANDSIRLLSSVIPVTLVYLLV